MTTEWGALAGVFPFDEVTAQLFASAGRLFRERPSARHGAAESRSGTTRVPKSTRGGATRMQRRRGCDLRDRAGTRSRDRHSARLRAEQGEDDGVAAGNGAEAGARSTKRICCRASTRGSRILPRRRGSSRRARRSLPALNFIWRRRAPKCRRRPRRWTLASCWSMRARFRCRRGAVPASASVAGRSKRRNWHQRHEPKFQRPHGRSQWAGLSWVRPPSWRRQRSRGIYLRADEFAETHAHEVRANATAKPQAAAGGGEIIDGIPGKRARSRSVHRSRQPEHRRHLRRQADLQATT